MGAFSIEIERLYKELHDQKQQLKGIFCIQYPLYCIHASITDSTPDPLDQFDQVIVQFLGKDPKLSAFQIASIMGTSKKLIEFRFDNLVRDGLLNKTASGYEPTPSATQVFTEKKAVRLHKRSHDFYVDGMSLNPLPSIFYGPYYQSKFLSEERAFYRTNPITGETYIVKPFAPDLVHTPPDKTQIISNISSITERDEYAIPLGLQSIEDLSFTKLSIHLLIAVTGNEGQLRKEILDGFALFSLRDNISYYETVKRNIRFFEKGLASRIENLEFKIVVTTGRDANTNSDGKVLMTSNWHEVDRYKLSQNKCFSFSSEDLARLIEKHFGFHAIEEENLVNTENHIALNVTRRMLLESQSRPKVIDALIRARDYKVWSSESSLDKNVFLIYIYYSTSDPFVKEVVRLKEAIKSSSKYTDNITHDWIRNELPDLVFDYRDLLIAAGEFSVLEGIDIRTHMLTI